VRVQRIGNAVFLGKKKHTLPQLYVNTQTHKYFMYFINININIVFIAHRRHVIVKK